MRSSGGKANTLVAEVELGVISSHKDISEDPERTIRSRDIHSDESRKADSLTSSGEVQDVLGRCQDKRGSGDLDVKVGEGSNLRAVHGGLSVGGRDQLADLEIIRKVRRLDITSSKTASTSFSVPLSANNIWA